MKILVTNSVPLNGGDEALLRAMMEEAARRWPGSTFTVLCKDPDRARPLLPDLDIDPDLEYASPPQKGRLGGVCHRLRRRTSFLTRWGRPGHTWDWLVSPAERRRVLDHYRRADVVLPAPGGYFHDFYAVEDRLRGLETALTLGKPVFLLGHSIGPFWKESSVRRVREVFNRVNGIWVREAISRSHLEQVGVRPELVHDGADMAFLYRRLAPELFRKKSGPPKTIGLSFRVWPLGDTAGAQQTLAKAEAFCRWLLSETDRRLLFLSTCQGVPGYIDDSPLALEIVGRLPTPLQERCRVDRERYPPRRLIAELGQCDAFIGMRLHTCLLAMLGGTPAMGLGYEAKTKGIYEMLGLEEYQVDFTEDLDAWLRCAGRFFQDYESVAETLQDRLDDAAERANRALEFVDNRLMASRT